MGLFSKCVVCGKTKLSSRVDRGVCSECYTKMTQESVEKKEIIDVSSLFQHTASDYSPPVANSGETTYVFVDVETTGLSPTKDAIVQVSALRYFGREFIDGLNSYVNPHRSIPETATAIHGITDDKVKDSPTIDQIEEPFFKLVKDAILVGHNVVFDLDFLNHAFHGALNGVEYIDTMRSSQAILNLPNYRLETVADYVEFYPEGGYHDALVDCTATAAIFFRLGFDKPFYARAYYSKKPSQKDYGFTPKNLVPAALSDDFQHPMRGKRIVFTGDLSIRRLDAAQMATDVGAIVRTSVSSKTDYLVVGVQDATIVGPNGMSGKERKAHELNEIEKASIKIISEAEFIALIGGT